MRAVLTGDAGGAGTRGIRTGEAQAGACGGFGRRGSRTGAGGSAHRSDDLSGRMPVHRRSSSIIHRPRTVHPLSVHRPPIGWAPASPYTIPRLNFSQIRQKPLKNPPERRILSQVSYRYHTGGCSYDGKSEQDQRSHLRRPQAGRPQDHCAGPAAYVRHVRRNGAGARHHRP